jgi:hypothetical protein
MGIRYVLQLLVENNKIANNSATTKDREKISTDLESLEFYKSFDVGCILWYSWASLQSLSLNRI